MYEWMNDGWMDGWMDGWTDGWMDGYKYRISLSNILCLLNSFHSYIHSSDQHN